MQFTKHGDLYVVTRITGPTHHMLGLVLSPVSPSGTPIVECVSFDHSQSEVEPFDPESALCRDVLTAVQDANTRWGTNFFVTKIRYCADDPPLSGIYGFLAKALVEHLLTEQAASIPMNFEQSDDQSDQILSSVSHRD
jgi:hypothetical protein